MASWALALAIIALVGVIVIMVVLWLFFKDFYKKEIASLNQRISNLSEGVAKEIIKDEEFQLEVTKEIDKKVKGSVSPLLSGIFELILNKSFAKLREFLPKFPRDDLAREVVEDIKKMHPQNQNSQVPIKEDLGRHI